MMKRVGEKKSGGIGVHAKSIPGRVTSGDGKEQTQGGHGGKGKLSGSATLKGNRNKTGVGRKKGKLSSAQSQRGRSRKTNKDIMRDAATALSWSLHPQRGFAK